MTSALSRRDDFRSSGDSPSGAATGRRDYLSVVTANPTRLSGLGTTATPLGNSTGTRTSLFAASNARTDLFAAIDEALRISQELVESGEASPIDRQTLEFAIKNIEPMAISMWLPPPLALPLQRGGIGFEWHSHGLNVELRFRGPFDVYAVVEDADGEVESFRGSDPLFIKRISRIDPPLQAFGTIAKIPGD